MNGLEKLLHGGKFHNNLGKGWLELTATRMAG